jgi:hypothetical protein
MTTNNSSTPASTHPATTQPGTPGVVVPTSPHAGANTSIGGALIGTVLSATILAALLAALVNVVLARRKSREEERARLRDRFAQAFSAYAEYCEFAYAVRRRSHVDPAAERVRISEQMRKVQAEIKGHEAWVRLESAIVGRAYSDLVAQMREVAGSAVRRGWKEGPATADDDANIPSSTVDLGPLKPYETAYMDAVAAHLKALTPWWAK